MLKRSQTQDHIMYDYMFVNHLDMGKSIGTEGRLMAFWVRGRREWEHCSVGRSPLRVMKILWK